MSKGSHFANRVDEMKGFYNDKGIIMIRKMAFLYIRGVICIKNVLSLTDG